MDVVVTIPKDAWLRWLAEGDLPGDESSGEWGCYFGGATPLRNLHPGDRVYVLAHGLIRGYAPLVRVDTRSPAMALVRAGGAVACTVLDSDGMPIELRGFQGIRYRWWERTNEAPMPDWMTRGVPMRDRPAIERLQRLREDPRHRVTLRDRAIGVDAVRATDLFVGLPL